MKKKFYHNITEGKLNESDIIDLIDEMGDDDIIYWTESGDATLHELTAGEKDALIKEVADYYQEQDEQAIEKLEK